MVEQWLNLPDYETRMASYECKVLFAVSRKDGKPMTEADSDAILAEASKTLGGDLDRDEEVEDEDSDDEMCFVAYVDFEIPIDVASGDQLSNEELKEYIGYEEANDGAAEAVLDIIRGVRKQYRFKWYDFDYDY